MAMRQYQKPSALITVPVSTRGRITVPPQVRKVLGLAPGGAVRFTVDDNGQVFVSAKDPQYIASKPAEEQKNG